MTDDSLRPCPPQLTRDERGLASLEYLIVMTALTIGIAACVAAMGPSVLELYWVRIAWLALPIP